MPLVFFRRAAGAACISGVLAVLPDMAALAQPKGYELPAVYLRGLEAVQEDVADASLRLQRDVDVLKLTDRLEEDFARLLFSFPPIAPPAGTIVAGLETIGALRSEAEAEPPMNPFFRQDIVSLELLFSQAVDDSSSIDWKKGADALRLVLSDAKMLYQKDRRELEDQRTRLSEQEAVLRDLGRSVTATLDANVWNDRDHGARMPR